MLYLIEKKLPSNYTITDIQMMNDLMLNAESVHQMLAKLYDANNSNWRAENNVLFKALNGGKWLLRSQKAPKAVNGISVTPIAEPALKDGQMATLYITASPYKQQGLGCRTFLADRDMRLLWLTNKLSHNNECSVEEISENERVSTYMQHSDQQKGCAHLRGFQYVVRVKVNDAKKLQNIIDSGIGPSKSYGFGLTEIKA